MKRKIVKHGNATLTVSLPARWVKRYCLKKGDDLEIKEIENNLVLSAEKETSPKAIEINIDSLDSVMLEWVLSALHKRGFDEIKLRYSKPRPKLIYDIVQQLMTGFAIIEQTDKMCLIKAIAKDDALEFDPTLKRVFLVVISFADSCLEYIKKGDFSKLEELFFLEKTVDRLVNFCERVLVKKGYKDFGKTCFLYLTAWNLEKISEYYYYLCLHLMKNKNVVNKSVIKSKKNIVNIINNKNARLNSMNTKVIDLLARTNELLRLFYDAFYNFDLNKLIQLNTKQKGIVSAAQSLIKGLSPSDTITVFYIQEIAIKINCTGLLTALNYERTAKDQKEYREF